MFTRNDRRVLFLIAVFAVVLGLVGQAKAAWGDLDTTFGNGGTYQDIGTNSYPTDVIMQPDGKILVTGYTLAANGKFRFMLRRFTANGAVDTTFGNGGSAVIQTIINTNNDYSGHRLVMLTASKIAVVGYAGDKVCVWLVNSNGYGNTDFGVGGQKILTGYNYLLDPRIAALSGKIVLGLFDKDLHRIVIARLNADGTDDTTFGTNGRSNTGIFHNLDNPPFPSFEIIAESDTKKITVGGITLPSGFGRFTRRFERIRSDGTPDFSFVTTVTEMYSSSIFSGFARTSGGEYIYIDLQNIGVTFDTNLRKLNTNGTAGISEPINDADKLIGIQSSGKIITGNGFGYKVNRYDAAFNFLEGIYSGYNTYSYLAVVQADDKLVFATRVNDKLTLKRWLAN